MNTNHQKGKTDPLVAEYSRVAEAYDSRWSFYVRATTRETIQRLNLQPAERLLDVGCGTGALLQQLSAKHPPERLYGADPVPEMLSVARRRLAPAIELREAWAERLPFDDEAFDVVVSCNMFHYIQEPIAALREIRRVLRPGGRLVITDWCDDYLACRLCDLYLRLFNRAHFKTYRRHECSRLLQDAGYTVAEIERYKINWLWGLMTAIAIRETA